jgi:hypothetical protein
VLTHFVAARSHVPSSSIGQAVGIKSDGNIVVAGLGAGYDFGLARYTSSGRLDPSFGRGGKVLTDLGSGRVTRPSNRSGFHEARLISLCPARDPAGRSSCEIAVATDGE